MTVVTVAFRVHIEHSAGRALAAIFLDLTFCVDLETAEGRFVVLESSRRKGRSCWGEKMQNTVTHGLQV